MRVSTGQIQRIMMQSMQQGGADYGKLLQQMSSGDRMLKPSDDPLATVRLQGIDKEISAIEQYEKNALQVTGRLGQQESQIDAMKNILLRLRDMTVEAGNGTYNLEERRALTQEMDSLKAGLLDLVNARNEEGHYLFSGSRTDVPAVAETAPGEFSYQGDNYQRQVSIANGVTVAANDTAKGLMFNGGNLLQEVHDFIQVLETTSGSISGSVADMLNSLDKGLGNLTRTLTDIGGRINGLEQVVATHGEMKVFGQGLHNELSALDYGEAAMNMQQMLLALQSSQQAFVNVNQLSLFNAR
ncbi:flagellar hook-associated protein FlgL [Oceanimonas baumannii]|uniref:Flagellar hook-associated protein 3 n=1 Tax=Oceanimonas baumannii TaxID=129578 RepID=A0A235CMJ2_9GAMM|nr:flagellar hook-associated protein FlgL [Oceanimonas baumannii]OYD25788.1 flagellar hook-associated protein 3 [Oceanimonas baumannii]TDW60201.1 flagellar hook-associated protein 3 FlgL [Oceanimonas baumannii]